MLQFDRIDISEGIDINKTDALKEYIVRCYWYFKDVSYKSEPHVCNGCHDISLMACKLKNIAMLNVTVVDYRCIFWVVTKNDAINMLGYSKSVDKGTL